MGLTVFVSQSRPLVRVLQWFLTPTETVEFACGPLVTFQAEAFRQKGVRFVHAHFSNYKTRRLKGEEIIPVFVTRGERRSLAKQRAIGIQVLDDPQDTLRLTPLELRKLSLNGLVPLPEKFARIVPLNATDAEFWKAFDEVLAAAKATE